MKTKSISLKKFSSAFQVLINQKIWRVIHPADGWITIDIGQKYISSFPGKDGKDEPYEKGQYQVHITGDWEIYTNGELIESRKVQGDDQKAYFDKMKKLVSNFPLTKIDAVELEKNVLVIKGDLSQIKVPINQFSDSISLSYVKFDSNNKPSTFFHYRFDDDIGSLAEVLAP